MTLEPAARERSAQAFAACRDMEGSLKDRLDALALSLRDINPRMGEAIDRLVARLRDAGAGENSPAIGDAMPDFLLPDETGRLTSLSELLQDGPVAVNFHRGHWCPYCRIAMATLVRSYDQIAAVGGRVVAIMPERQEFAAAFKRDTGAPFPILTDIDNAYALACNLMIWVGDELRERMQEIGRDLTRYQGTGAWTLPIPAVFIIGRDGRVKARFVDPDYRRRMQIDDIVAALADAAAG